MGVLLKFPTLEITESDAKRILDNVANAVCMPIPKAQAIIKELGYINYKFQRSMVGMSAIDLDTLGLTNDEYEAAYQNELAQEASEGDL